MHTCCRVRPTSRPRCPSCSPSTSKLCCAFSPFSWLLTSKPWPGRGFLKLSQALSSGGGGKLLGCRSTKFSCAPASSRCFGGQILGCSSSVPSQHPDWRELSFPGCICYSFRAPLSSTHTLPVFPARCCSVRTSTGQLGMDRTDSSSSEEDTQCFGLGFQSVRAITHWNKLLRAGRFC